MSKEWRPDNWDTIDIYAAILGDRLPTTEDLIEAGADAILHALCNVGKGRCLRLGKADNGHIIILVEK